MWHQCPVCEEKFRGRKDKVYCTSSCSIKAWKNRDREGYLASKKRYRDKHRNSIRDYNSEYRKQYVKVSNLREKLFGNDPCLRCGATDDLHVHHVRRRVEGGDDTVSNCTVLCGNCHRRWHSMLDEELTKFWKSSPKR